MLCNILLSDFTSVYVKVVIAAVLCDTLLLVLIFYEFLAYLLA